MLADNQSTDGVGGMIPAMVAELLDVPGATSLHELAIEPDAVPGFRATDTGMAGVHVELPAVVSITDALPDPRIPNFKGIMAAKKKPVKVLTLGDLGNDADAATTPRAVLTAIEERPARAIGVKVVDSGDAAEQLVQFLVERRLAGPPLRKPSSFSSTPQWTAPQPRTPLS